jgi:predicted ester cyclase
MVEKNKEIAGRLVLEAFNEGRLEVVDEVMSADLDDHSMQPGLPPGREGVKALIRAVRSAFPDIKNTIIRQVAEGDIVVQQIRSAGTMEGDFMGMKATGRRATWDAVHIVRLQDEKIVEHWAVQDQLSLLQQLGLAPSQPAQAA